MSTEAPEVDFGDDDDGAAAFFENLTGKPDAAKTTEEAPEGTTEEEGTTTPEGEEAPEGTPEGEAEGTTAPPAEDDEGEVELTYGDEKKKVSVKDIKRLMEAETSLTTKTAAIVAAEATATASTQRATVALNKMLERAKANFEPYSKLNFLALAKDPDITAATLEVVQKEAQAAYDAVKFFETELNDITTKAQADAHAANTRAAGEAVKVLNDKASPHHIPGFNKEVYEGIVDFAAKQGLDRSNVLAIVNPAHLKLIHMAMEFQKGQKAAVTKVTKVVQKPTRVLKPSAASSSTTASQKHTDALARLRKSGSEEDAADAFMAGLRSKD